MRNFFSLAFTGTCPGRSAVRRTSQRSALQSRGPGYLLLEETGVPVLRSSASQELRAASRPGHEPSPAARQTLDQPIEIFVALIERFYQHPLVLAVGAEVVEVAGQPRMAVGWDAGVAQIAAVGGAGAHGRQHHGAGPEFLRQFFDLAHDLL